MAYFSLFILYGVPSKFTILSVTVLIVIKLNNLLTLTSTLNTKSQTRIGSKFTFHELVDQVLGYKIV